MQSKNQIIAQAQQNQQDKDVWAYIGGSKSTPQVNSTPSTSNQLKLPLLSNGFGTQMLQRS
jgi:hypothetical protein